MPKLSKDRARLWLRRVGFTIAIIVTLVIGLSTSVTWIDEDGRCRSLNPLADGTILAPCNYR